jgi:hypothetical protein
MILMVPPSYSTNAGKGKLLPRYFQGSATVSVAGRCVPRRPSDLSSKFRLGPLEAKGFAVCDGQPGEDVFGEASNSARATGALPEVLIVHPNRPKTSRASHIISPLIIKALHRFAPACIIPHLLENRQTALDLIANHQLFGPLKSIIIGTIIHRKPKKIDFWIKSLSLNNN